MSSLSYTDKQKVLEIIFAPYKVRGNEFNCSYKNIPIALYEKYKEFIDYTAFYGVFRGKREFKMRKNYLGNMVKYYDSSTRKRNAVRVDLYMNDERKTELNRVARYTYLRLKARFDVKGI